MILNEFFNLPQVFEKDMTEGAMSEIDLELRDIVAREDFDALYELFSANTPAGRFVQDMYDDVVIDTGLHPDDDFERIEQIVFDRLADDFGEQDVEEGMFGSRPSPVLPIVDKIAKVARELTPQNVETGKQIIQANARDITRMLSPQDKAGVDVIEQGMAEGPKEVVGLANFAMGGGILGGQNPTDILSEKGVAEDGPVTIGSRLPKSNIETFGLEPGRGYKINNPKDWKQGDRPRAVQQLIPTQDKKDHIRSRLGKHVDPVLPEAKDDYVPPKEANYDDKYQAMVRRVGQKAKQQEKAKQQPKAPVRENRLALLKQIIQS